MGLPRRRGRLWAHASALLGAGLLSACAAPTGQGLGVSTAAAPVPPFDTAYHRGTFTIAGAVHDSGCQEQVTVRMNAAMTLDGGLDRDEVPFRMRLARAFGPTCFTNRDELNLEGALVREGSAYRWHAANPSEDLSLDLTLAPDARTLSGTFRDEYHFHGGQGDTTGALVGQVVLTKAGSV